MIAVDTNIFARFHCDDPDDSEAKRQQVIAKRVIVESEAISFVPLTVVLELEWVMRGFHEAERSSFCDAMAHLLGMRHVTVERWEAVNDAVNLHRRGLDFADALHLTSGSACNQLASFDGRRFVRGRRMKLSPEAVVPKLFRCSHQGGGDAADQLSLFFR
jgi:predicted nucleic-acid-binding protein